MNRHKKTESQTESYTLKFTSLPNPISCAIKPLRLRFECTEMWFSIFIEFFFDSVIRTLDHFSWPWSHMTRLKENCVNLLIWVSSQYSADDSTQTLQFVSAVRIPHGIVSILQLSRFKCISHILNKFRYELDVCMENSCKLVHWWKSERVRAIENSLNLPSNPTLVGKQ